MDYLPIFLKLENRLTVVIGGISNLPVLRMVVLEALAVNAGSTLSPIGNPQNLLLWQHARLPFLHFVVAMLPAAVVMFALLAAFTLLWLPRDGIKLSMDRMSGQTTSKRLGTASMIGLVGMVDPPRELRLMVAPSGRNHRAREPFVNDEKPVLIEPAARES